MKSIPEIIFEEMPGFAGNLGLITLNRSQVLNALNHSMFIALDEQLAEWENNAAIKAVVIRAAEGRAFCAGGDIRAIYNLKQQSDANLDEFFRDEYRMNSRIYHFPKPYIALLDGITMGGGVGISLHGSHRIATEKLLFAMPETSIGFYPDVGTTHYLSRLPSRMGYYLGLTGARITHADCFALGIVQEIVRSDSLAKIIDVLVDHEINDAKQVDELLKPFAVTSPASELLEHQIEIEICFSKNTVEEILSSLEQHSSEWCQQTATLLKTKSPISLKVTLKALQEASQLNFDSSIRMDYSLTCHFVEGHDFFEGIRAVVIDKDQKPRWQPATLGDVSLQAVGDYFNPLMKELGATSFI